MGNHIRQSLIDAAHGRKCPERAAAGAERSKIDGRPRCPECGIMRYPRNWYAASCYCGYEWQPLPAPPTE